MPQVKIGDGFSSWSADYYNASASVTVLSSNVEQNKSRIGVELKYRCNSSSNEALGVDLAQLGVGEIEFVSDGVLSPEVTVRNIVEDFRRVVQLLFEVDISHSSTGILEAFYIDVRGKLIYNTENNYSYFINDAGEGKSILVDTSDVDILPIYSMNVRLKDEFMSDTNTIATSVSINGEFVSNNHNTDEGTFYHNIVLSKCLRYTDTVSIDLSSTPPERLWNIYSNLSSLDILEVDRDNYTIDFVVSELIENNAFTGQDISINVHSKVCLTRIQSATYSDCALNLNMEIPTGRYGYTLSFTCGDTTFPDSVPKRTDSNVNIALASKHFAALEEAGENSIRIDCRTGMDDVGTFSYPTSYDVPIDIELASIVANSDSYNLGSEAALSYSNTFDIFDYSIRVLYGSVHNDVFEKWIGGTGYLSEYEEFFGHNTIPHSLELTSAYAMPIPNTASGILSIYVNTYAKKDDNTRVLLGSSDVIVNYSVPNTISYKPAIMELYYHDGNSVAHYLATGSTDNTIRNTTVTHNISNCIAYISVLPKVAATIQSIKIGDMPVEFVFNEENSVYSGSIEIPISIYTGAIPVSIIDSRGFETIDSFELLKTGYNYTPISVANDSVVVKRAPNKKGFTTAVTDYTKIQVTMKLIGSMFNFGSETNQWYVYYSYMIDGILYPTKKLLFSSNDLTDDDITDQYGSITFTRLLNEDFPTDKNVSVRYYVYDTHEHFVSDGDISPLSGVISPYIAVESFKPVFDFGEDSFNLNVDLLIRNENIFSLIYPVGAIYTTARDNVPEYFSGTWTNIGSTPQGSVIVKYFQRTG